MVCLVVDAKMQVLDQGRGVATLSFLAKTGLRRTNLGRSTRGHRTQGSAYTTRAIPFLQATIHAETTENYTRLFRCACEIWRESCVDGLPAETRRPPLEVLVRQVHKDFAPAIEAARAEVFKQSRPCDDFFHFTQREKTFASKCKSVVLRQGRWSREHFAWAWHAIHCLRHAPTLDLFSLLYQGWRVRLLSLGEEELVNYLDGMYIRPVAFAQAQRMRISFRTADQAQVFSFAGFWSGCFGVVPGTCCGSEAAEALRGAWQAELDALGGRGGVVTVLETLQ